MTNTSNCRSAWVVSLLLLLTVLPRIAGAQDTKLKITDAEFTAYQKLRLAHAVAEQKRMFAHDKDKKDAIDSEWNKTLSDAKWTTEHYDEVDSTVSQIIDALAGLERPDDAENAKATLAEMDSGTIAMVKSRRKDHTDYNELEKQAQAIVREEADLIRRGPAPTPEQLQGKWVIDLDATVASLGQGLPDETLKKIRVDLEKIAGTSYTFGPGGTMSANTSQANTASNQSGGYRMEGSNLIFTYKSGKRDREMKLTVGIKNDRLMIGMMGIYTAFRKE